MATRTPAAIAERVPLTNVEAAVLVSGATSMGLEILAGRIVAPEFGNSIYTWGSIIGVFLTALSIGYALGGRRAATRASPAAIVTILAQSALFVAFVLVAGDAVLQVSDALPVPGRFAPIIPLTVLFGPPVFLLGFISPYAAELSERTSTGGASGRVYALGTVGSIVGAFATTFFLVPSFDVLLIEIGFGLLLLVAAAGVARRTVDYTGWARIVVAAMVLAAAVLVGTTGLSVGENTVYETQTPYQDLRVADDDGVRTLYLDGAPHSAMDLDAPYRHVFTYTSYFHVPLLLTEDVDRVLFIGGGGFTGPKRFVHEYPNVTVDVVELDPEVVRVAKEYFGVQETDRLNVYTQDGRRFLDETDETYDVIVLDAYRSDRVPYHMTTVEFMQQASDHLDEDGVLLANIISARSGSGSAFYRSELKTTRQVFPQTYAFPTADTPFLQNIELVATKDPQRVTQAELHERNRERDVGIDLGDEIDNYVAGSAVPTDDVPVLRDDQNPADRLLDEQLGRRYVIERNESGEPARPAESVGAVPVGPPAAIGSPAAIDSPATIDPPADGGLPAAAGAPAGFGAA